MPNTDITVLRFDDRRVPRALTSLPAVAIKGAPDIDQAVSGASRVVVLGTDADLAAVLTRLLRTDRLDLEVAHLPGSRGVLRAQTAAAQRVPLIRDETGTVLVGAALWLPGDGEQLLTGEAVVDDERLFDGQVTSVRIEPTTALPGLRAAVVTGPLRRRLWLSGRAAQLGTTGARVIRDGVPAPREVKRSTFYRHTTGWLRVS